MTGGDRAGPRVLIVGHADTVWPAGTAAEWPVRRDGDLLSGPGVGDMKGCLVMAAHACAAVRDAGGLPGIGALELLVVPDEELGSVGSRAWIEDRARGSHACLGLEAGWPGGGLDVERGAVGALRLTATGRTAHAPVTRDGGASAVAALAPLVTELERLSRPERGMLVTVGVFRGGVARQVVPDHAELLIDLRAPDRRPPPTSCWRGSGDGRRRADRASVGLQLSGGVTRPAFPRAASDVALRAGAGSTPSELGIASRGRLPGRLGRVVCGRARRCRRSMGSARSVTTRARAASGSRSPAWPTRGALMGLLIADLGDPGAPRPKRQARASGNVDAPA